MLKEIVRSTCHAGHIFGLVIVLSGADVTINPDVTYQTIDGFGTAITPGGSAGLYADDDFLDFLSYDLGMSLFRASISNDILSTPVEDPADIRWEDLDPTTIGQKAKSVGITIDFARGLKQRRPETRIIGTAWTPPAWMKDNQMSSGTRSGFLLDNVDPDNRLSDDKYDHFAKYIVEYTRLFAHYGVPFYAISPANELMFTQVFESCMYTAEEFARIVRRIGVTFTAEGIVRPLIYGPEEMTVAHYGTTRHRPYVDALMAADTRDYFDIFATHGYTDGFQSDSPMGPALYWSGISSFGRPYWITEGGTGGHNWPTPITTGMGAYLHYALAEGNTSAFVAWQISTITPDEHGVMHITKPTKKTYAAMHYWRYIRPGFVRMDAEVSGSNSSDFRISASRDVSRQRVVIVVINTSTSTRELNLDILGNVNADALEVFRTTSSETENFLHVGTIDLSSANPSVSLPGRSIVTLVSLVPASGVSLSSTQLDLSIGRHEQLIATIEPLEATNQKLRWESSDPSVATVDRVGRVTGIDEGNAVIMVSSDDGNFSASANVNVSFGRWAEWPVQASAYVDTGDDFIGVIYACKDSGWVYSFNLNAWIYLPEDFVDTDSAWAYITRRGGGGVENSTTSTPSPSFGSISVGTPFVEQSTVIENVLLNKPVQVSSQIPSGVKENLTDGNFSASTDSTRWITTFVLADPVPTEWAKIDMGALYQISEFRLHPFESRDYRYTIAVSEDGVEYTTVVNRLQNQSGAVFTNAVDVVGRYVLLTVHFPTSGASYRGGYVNIQELEGYGYPVDVPVTGVRLQPENLARGVGQTYALRANVIPAIASDAQILWSSDNTQVASVDSGGVVTAASEGNAEITATTHDGGFTATTLVTVGAELVWGDWQISAGNMISSDDFLGEVKVSPGSGWIYLYDVGRWAWLPESAIEQEGAWVLLIR